jgi:hypothetical protein
LSADIKLREDLMKRLKAARIVHYDAGGKRIEDWSEVAEVALRAIKDWPDAAKSRMSDEGFTPGLGSQRMRRRAAEIEGGKSK